jgi:hypothetical protein
MEAPKTLSEALDALSLARADFAAFEALTAEHNAQLAAHNALAERFAAVSAALDEANARNRELALALDAAKAEQATAAEQATRTLSALGVDPVQAIAETQAVKSKDQLWQEYNALPLRDRNAFFAANKAVMGAV